jgi:dethiobiotin synthetase
LPNSTKRTESTESTPRVLQEYFASCQVVEIVISSKLTLGFLGHVLLRLNLVRQMNLLSAL